MIEVFFKNTIDRLSIYPYEIEKYGEELISMLATSDEFIKLMGNESPYPPSPRVFETIRKFESLNRYPDPTYLRLRKKLSEYTGREVNEIMVGPGSLGLMDIIYKSFINPSDKLFIHIPTYTPYLDRLRVYDALPLKSRVFLNRDGISIDHHKQVDEAKHAKMIVIINPNNPIGYVISKDDIQRYLETGKIVVVDEAYYEFYGLTALDLLDDFENLIILRTLSKAFGLAGVRLGYLIANKKVVKYIRKTAPPFPLSSLVEEIGIAALSDIDYMKNIVRNIISERDKVYKELSRVEGVTPYKSMANFLLVRIDHPRYPNVSKLVTDLLARRILVRDLSRREGLEPGKYFRLTIGNPEENSLFIDSLKELLGD